jgi:ankyrin repeat protein
LGSLKVVQWLLLEGKVDIDRKGVSGKTVLQASERGATSLLLAALPGHIKMAQWLVEVGLADVNPASENGATPLFVAAQEGHAELVEVMVTWR